MTDVVQQNSAMPNNDFMEKWQKKLRLRMRVDSGWELSSV